MDVIERPCHQRPQPHSHLIVYLFDLGSSSSELIFEQKFADLPDSKFEVSFGFGSLGWFGI
ncbi:hypothetical protein [Shewanella sp. MTB7]|uniref:hypothetical protein n=1 Tax=Shewanella sp. MTB7 TaxID=2746932 RepID=UPI0022BA504F|nr:hypothetical protein [Shewanella sp. MTB7]WBJ96683.1 hypothetical protein HWQ47_06085 [Shewanella sp. MTB7]